MNTFSPIKHYSEENPKTGKKKIIRQWFVVYTKYRREKVVGKTLSEMGFDTYVPTYETITRSGKKKRTVQQVVFPSYVFIRMRYPLDKQQVFETEGIMGFVKTGIAPSIVPEKEIELIKMAMGTTCNSRIGSGLLHEGDKVEIVSGVLRGAIGYVSGKRGQRRILINIDSIKYHLDFELPPSRLRIIERDPRKNKK